MDTHPSVSVLMDRQINRLDRWTDKQTDIHICMKGVENLPHLCYDKNVVQ
jgi:hypothetical protein